MSSRGVRRLLAPLGLTDVRKPGPEAGFGILVMTNQGGTEGEAAVTGLVNRLRSWYTDGTQ